MCHLEAFYKGRNNAEPIDQKEANYSRVIDCYPVAVGNSCPTKAQLKVLGLTDKNEVRRLQQRWWHAQGKIESIDWSETFKKTAPTIQQVEDMLNRKPFWCMTAKTLLSLWSPRSSWTNCDQSDKQANHLDSSPIVLGFNQLGPATLAFNGESETRFGDGWPVLHVNFACKLDSMNAAALNTTFPIPVSFSAAHPFNVVFFTGVA